MRPQLLTWNIAAGLLAPALLLLNGARKQDQRQSLVRAMQIAEDSRASDSASLRPLRDGLHSADANLQALAVRAFGRLEKAEFIAEIAPQLRSTNVAVRVEAAQALAQMTMGTGSAADRAAASNTVFLALSAAADAEREPRVRAALARSLSRIQLSGAAQAGKAESVALSLVSPAADSATVVSGMLALERLVRLNGRSTPPSIVTLDTLRKILLRRTTPAAARRYAYMSLAAAQQMSGELVEQTVSDPDEQVRRLSATTVALLEDTQQRERLMAVLLRDQSQMVRLEVVRGWLRRGPASACAPLVRAIDDPAVNVGVAAIDALTLSAERCPLSERAGIVEVLTTIVRRLAIDGTAGYVASSRTDLHKGARAVVVLARLDPSAARDLLGGLQTHASWVARMYAATAATTLSDTATLSRLALNPNGNVRAAAITGLARVAGQSATPMYLAGLEHSDYNVVRVAAGALRQSSAGAVVRDALLEALARITREKKETSRDARMALLERIGELASASDSSALHSYLTDFDPAVADRAAQLLTRWLGRAVASAPLKLPPADAPPADAGILSGTSLRFVMSAQAGSGVFEMELLPGAAPYTVARIVRLARAGYYNGLTFHRVAANFVVQGGSPGANEYVGDGPFLRDEIWLHTHERGSVGVSTRGRDTGDAQIFVNTIDSPRLDFDYTVFARVTYGMALVDGILEGDVIDRVEVLRAARLSGAAVR